MMQNLEEFKSLVSNPKRCVIIMHTKPDADALGSSLGLAAYLKKKSHHVDVISPSDYPKFLRWMEGSNEVFIHKGDEDRCKETINQAEIIFCLDFSSLNRIEGLGDVVGEANATKVLVDHHIDPEDFADFVSWSTKAAATAELIYDLIVDLGDKDLIDKPIAENLYAGLMTDTGSFKHPSTTEHVFQVAAGLVNAGADVNGVSRAIYDSNSLSRLRLIGYALSEKLVVLPEYKTAYFELSGEDLRMYDYSTGDSEGLVNYGLSIEGISLAVTFIEREDGVKMSFRSVGEFSVNQFARDNFNGGGHKNAAGGKSDLSLSETVLKFKGLLEKYKEELLIEA